ncbi:SPARC-like protein 1 [Heterodontus francisci]|uniref:SPARC-like protein 1 n=1 Tax=Heterodontus francisci TaxID=7792 RepID=UPI00355B3105
MKTAILTTFLVAVTFASPIRKTRDINSGSNEQLFNINQQNIPPMVRFGNPFLSKYFPLQRTNQNYPNYRVNSRFPFYNYYNPNQYYPNYNDPNYNYHNPSQYYPNIFNGYPTRYNSDPSLARINYLGENGPQMNALSMSTEMSAEDTSSMEDTQIIIPFVPGVPDYEGPFPPDYEGAFAPGVDANAVDVGFDQQNSQELAPEVSNTEEPASVLPYSDSLQRLDSLGLNLEDDSMIGESYEGISQQDVIYEPAGLDVNYDETLNNEEFVNQQASNENSDEDEQTEENENVGTNTMDMNSMALSNDEDDDGTESNLNVADSSDDGPDSEDEDNTQSNEDNTNQVNEADSEDMDNTQSNEDNPNQVNEADSEDEDNTQSNEDNPNQVNEADSEDEDNTQSNEDNPNQVNEADSEDEDNTQSNEGNPNQVNEADSMDEDNTQSNEDNPNQVNEADSNDDDGTNTEEDDENTDSNANNEAGFNQGNIADSNVSDNESNGINFSDNGTDFNQGENGDGANEDDSNQTNAEVDNIQNEVNSCKSIHCRHGRVCKLNEMGNPTCICQDITTCPVNIPELQQVCGTNNRTYGNSCQFFASKCLLEGTKKEHSIHLDYLGPCKYIAPCLNNELNEFPLRLRDWLKNILIQMYEQDQHSPGLLSQKERTVIKKIYDNQQRLHPGDHTLDLLFNDFNQNYHMFIYPVHWQFSQLDRHPVDGYLTHSELAPLRTPLIPLEHCTSRFFTECNLDGDRDISLREWCRCFSIKEEDINPNFVF